MIQVNKYPEVRFEHFDPNGNSLGFLNQLESLDLCCQIVEESVKNNIGKSEGYANSGYYLKIDDRIVHFTLFGDYSDYPKGLWDGILHLFSRKLKARKLIPQDYDTNK